MNQILESIRNFFSVPPKAVETVEDLKEATQAEEDKAVELQAILEAKQKLSEAQQKTRELAEKIESMGKPKPKSATTARSSRI